MSKSDWLNIVNNIVKEMISGENSGYPLPGCSEIDSSGLSDAEQQLIRNIFQLRDKFTEASHFANVLSEGKLEISPPRDNNLASPVKNIHASLKHLNWHTHQLVKGDLNQQIDFLGDFSNSFNKLIEVLREKKQAEARLINSKKQLQAVFDASPDGLVISNSSGAILNASDAAVHLWNYSDFSEVAGRNIIDFVHPEERNKTLFFLDELKKGIEYSLVEYRMIRSDGSEFYCEVSGRKIIETENINELFLFAIRDITQRKLAEQALRESEERFRTLFDTAAAGIYIVRDGRFVEVNPAITTITGYSRCELLNMELKQMLHPENYKDLISMSFKRQKGETAPFAFEAKIIARNGSEKWVAVNSGRIIFEGQPSNIGSAFYITERKNLEKQLISNLDIRDKFFSVIAHDLKGPVGSMDSFLDILIKTDWDVGMMKEYLQMLKKTSSKVYELLLDLLSWAQTQRGEIRFQPQMNNLFHLVQQNIEVQSTNLFNKRIEVRNNVHPDFNFTFDQELLNTVIRNLLSNAIKYSQSGGEIIISSELNRNEVVISIADKGVGMTEEQTNMIFDNRLRVKSKPGTEGETGTGLGLLLCKEFVAKHNGRITIQSKPGSGSTFRVILPV